MNSLSPGLACTIGKVKLAL